MSQVVLNKRLPFTGYAGRALAAAIIATVINLIVYAIGKSAGAFPDSIKVMADNALQPSNVIMMTVMGTVLGILIFAAVGSIKVFRIIAIIAFIILLYTPFSVANASASFIVVLEIMHIIAAIVTIGAAGYKTRT